jgi:hypothetical protein
VFDVFAIMLIIGLRDWRTAPSPCMSRIRHFCTVRNFPDAPRPKSYPNTARTW